MIASAGIAVAVSVGEDAARQARDATYEAYVRSLEGGDVEVVGFDELEAALAGYRVVGLGGYSGLDYQHPEMLREQIQALVATNGDRTAYVLGGTADGIGRAYAWIPEVASERGLGEIVTAGIVSRNAAEYGVAPQDYVVFVDTAVDSWEVVVDGRSRIVEIAQRTGGELVYFRGGRVSKTEIAEALRSEVPVTIYTGEAFAPNAEKLKKKRQRDPNYEADGTAEFVGQELPNLTVVTVEPQARQLRKIALVEQPAYDQSGLWEYRQTGRKRLGIQ